MIAFRGVEHGHGKPTAIARRLPLSGRNRWRIRDGDEIEVLADRSIALAFCFTFSPRTRGQTSSA